MSRGGCAQFLLNHAHLPQSTAYAPATPATESAKKCTSHIAHDVNCAQHPLVCQHEVQH